MKKCIAIFLLLSVCIITQAQHFSGSTPGDAYIRSLLRIAPDEKCEFMKWELALHNNTFDLTVLYGESRPNTNGFKAPVKKQYSGKITRHEDVYELQSESFSTAMRLAEVDQNILHLLNAEKKLVIGNGGFGYVLNRIEKPAANSTRYKTGQTLTAGRFVGRTPCQELAAQIREPATPECIKIKWSLVLKKDNTYAITGFAFKRDKPHTGKWRITKGIPVNPDASVLQLDVADGKTFYFLVGDNNVLFFLDQQKNLMVGNYDFSYTLNREDK